MNYNENQPIKSNEKKQKSEKYMKKNENQRIYTKRNVFQQKLTNKYKIQYNITKTNEKLPLDISDIRWYFICD